MALKLGNCSCCGNYGFIDTSFAGECKLCIDYSPPERWAAEPTNNEVVEYDDLIDHHEQVIRDNLRREQ